MKQRGLRVDPIGFGERTDGLAVANITGLYGLDVSAGDVALGKRVLQQSRHQSFPASVSVPATTNPRWVGLFLCPLG